MKKLILAALAVAMCMACSDDVDGFSEGGTSLRVETSIGTKGRAFISGKDFVGAGHQIGVALFDEATGGPYDQSEARYVNVPYVSSLDTPPGSRVLWSSQTPIALSPVQGKAYAYHPYSDKVTDLTAVPVESASQTDYMYSDAVSDVSAVNPQAQFTLRHALTAVDVYLKKGPDYPFPG